MKTSRPSAVARSLSRRSIALVRRASSLCLERNRGEASSRLVDLLEHVGLIDQMLGDDVDDPACRLHLAAAGQHLRAQDGAALLVEQRRPDDQVGDIAFVLERNEHHALHRGVSVMQPAVAYIRVSTKGQGRSGLGLEAQQDALDRFAKAEGFTIIETFSETETGKGADALDRRPKLAAALKAARKLKTPVLVAKLDRLSRDVHFISGLMQYRTPFIVADLPGRQSCPPPRPTGMLAGGCAGAENPARCCARSGTAIPLGLPIAPADANDSTALISASCSTSSPSITEPTMRAQ